MTVAAQPLGLSMGSRPVEDATVIVEGDRIYPVEPDLVAVAGDPLEDVDTLCEMRLVTCGGIEVDWSKEA
jgi:hypothetical protein